MRRVAVRALEGDPTLERIRVPHVGADPEEARERLEAHQRVFHARGGSPVLGEAPRLVVGGGWHAAPLFAVVGIHPSALQRLLLVVGVRKELVHGELHVDSVQQHRGKRVTKVTVVVKLVGEPADEVGQKPDAVNCIRDVPPLPSRLQTQAGSWTAAEQLPRHDREASPTPSHPRGLAERAAHEATPRHHA